MARVHALDGLADAMVLEGTAERRQAGVQQIAIDRVREFVAIATANGLQERGADCVVQSGHNPEGRQVHELD